MNMQGRMSDQQYEVERARIAKTKVEAQQQAGVRWEQQLADLFYRSGWTLEQLAKKEGLKTSYVSTLASFGRFLGFSSIAENAEFIPNNLSAARFRDYWRRTEKGGGNERIRFKQIIEMMRGETVLHRSKVHLNHGPKIKEKFGDGKWHSEEAIVEGLNVPRTEIIRSMDLMCSKGSYGAKGEKKRVGTSFHYRIFPQEKTISLAELIEKISPIIKELKAEENKHVARVVPIVCARCAALLQRLLDEWGEKELTPERTAISNGKGAHTPQRHAVRTARLAE